MRHATMILAMLVTFSPAFAEGRPVSLAGSVLFDGAAMPGATVRLLERGDEVASAVADVDGRYELLDAPRGYYDLEASLDGLQSVSQEIWIGSEDVIADPMEFPGLVVTETITFNCNSPCDGEGRPSCEDYNRNRALESDAAANPRAIDELRERYRHTTSREERARIGGFFISVLDDDEEYIRPLLESTEMLLWLAERSESELREDQPDYVAWCNASGHDPERELWLLYSESGALLGSTDSRAIPFAHRALRARDFGLKVDALALAGLTCDASLLKAIYDDFDSIVENGGKYSILGVLPCGDQALNERILALENSNVEDVLPDIVRWREETLARLRPLPR